MKMKNLLDHVTEPLLICGIERKGGHHHMFETTWTHTNEDRQQDCKYPIFHKNLRMCKQKHMTLLIRRSWSWLNLFCNINYQLEEIINLGDQGTYLYWCLYLKVLHFFEDTKKWRWCGYWRCECETWEKKFRTYWNSHRKDQHETQKLSMRTLGKIHNNK